MNSLNHWCYLVRTHIKKKLEQAGEIGNLAHNWIEQYIKDTINGYDSNKPFPIDDRAKNCCLAALKWMADP